jgi:hypothetical protein
MFSKNFFIPAIPPLGYFTICQKGFHAFAVVLKHFPVDKTDGKWRWYDAYRFTVPGWEECTIVGHAAAKRVISGRTDPAVLNTLGINPSGKSEQARRNLPKTETEEPERTSVLRTIHESRGAPSLSAPQAHPRREAKSKSTVPE